VIRVDPALIALFVLVVVALYVVAGSIVTVPAGEVWLVERLGRYQASLPAGRHLLLPFVDGIRHRHTLADATIDVPRAVYRTRDGALVAVDSRLTYRITDAAKASYGVADHRAALAQFAQTALVDAVAGIDLSEANASRSDVGRAVAARMAAQTGAWGIAVLGHEITDLNRQWKESA
jgi:regulator of protease activity HflC (stomatin/prohibitin superfamily)